MLKNFTDLLERVKSIEPRTVSVAVAQDEAVMSAVRDAAKNRLYQTCFGRGWRKNPRDWRQDRFYRL